MTALLAILAILFGLLLGFSPLVLFIWSLVDYNSYAQSKLKKGPDVWHIVALIILYPFSNLFYGLNISPSSKLRSFSTFTASIWIIALSCLLFFFIWFKKDTYQGLNTSVAKLESIEAYDVTQLELNEYQSSLKQFRREYWSLRFWEPKKTYYYINLALLNFHLFQQPILTREKYEIWHKYYDSRQSAQKRRALMGALEEDRYKPLKPIAAGGVKIRKDGSYIENCVAVNFLNLNVAFEKGFWVIKQKDEILFMSFKDQNEARIALTMIQNNRVSKRCHIGQPLPKFIYLLNDQDLPILFNTDGEKCVSFSPESARVEAASVSGWKVSGGEMLVSFVEDPFGKVKRTSGELKGEAEQTLSIIKKYNFKQQCYIGSPASLVPFMYWKA